MRYAILGDIHSNLEALSAVLALARKTGVDGFFSVGDIVGYGPDPEPCMDLLAAAQCRAVAGNHDEAVAGLTDFSHYSDGARAGIIWTQEKIAASTVSKLKALPLTLETPHFSVVHASLESPSQWPYILDGQHAVPSIALQKQPVCFYGHTHLPVVFRDDGMAMRFHEACLSLDKKRRYLINAGSVGQPRDGIALSCLLVYDTEASTVQLHRVEYEVGKTQQKILQEGLPSSLALRLSYGR